MLKNYLKVALRDLRRHKGYTILNVGGLTVALTSALLIFLYVADELSFDRFHRDADRIYRVVWEEENEGQQGAAAFVPGTTYRLFRDELPEVEETTFFHELIWGDMIRRDGQLLRVPGLVVAGSNYFEFFNYDFVEGNSKTALEDPFSIVLTASSARHILGTGSALGKQVELTKGVFNRQFFTVTGVVEDVPENSSFPFEGAISMNSLPEDLREQRWAFTFIRLREGTSADKLQLELHALTRKLGSGSNVQDARGIRSGYALEPITSVHLFSKVMREGAPWAPERRGSAPYVFSLALIGVFVLILACINYVNLSTVRAIARAKEVGIRKVVGATRGQLVQQHLMESMFIVFSALALAVGLVEMLLPAYDSFMGVPADFLADVRWYAVPLLIFSALALGVLAGGYPALCLSRYRPALVVKGVQETNRGGLRLRRSLVVFQFAVSIALIAATVLVHRQLEFARKKDLGFDQEQVLVIKGPEDVPISNSHIDVVEQVRPFGQEVRKIPEILHLARADFYPANSGSGDISWSVSYYSDSTLAAGGEQAGSVPLKLYFADEGLIPTLRLRLSEGRNFDAIRDEGQRRIILNESAVRALGLQHPIGERLYYQRPYLVRDEQGNTKRLVRIQSIEIVGVVEDFHFRSFHEPIAPVVIEWTPGIPSLIRVMPGDPRNVIKKIRTIWEKVAPELPFIYGFLDDEVDAAYRNDRRFGALITVFSGLAILIACLGIVGLGMFAAERRRKEISIRKVFGASVRQMVALLSKEFLYLVGIAFVVAVPLAYVGVSRWLDNFAYRIEITPAYFVLAGLLALLLALTSVSYHALKAALANPADVLRYE